MTAPEEMIVVPRTEARETPAASALGFHTLAIGAGMDIFGADRVAALFARDGEALCPGAMLTLVDHALGARVLRTNRGTSTSTVDLRMEWVSALPAAGQLRATARSLPLRNGIVFADAVLEGEGGVFARASGTFAAGMLPGGAAATKRADTQGWQRVHGQDFRNFTGIEWQNDILVLPPAAHLIGAVELPAFHGGIVAGVMQLAAQDRATLWNADASALSMTMRFLRPAVALQPVAVLVEVERAGKRMASLKAIARQDDRTVAAGEYLFWRANEGLAPS